MVIRRFNYLLLASCLLLICLYSCNKKGSSKATIDQDSLLIKYQALSDSVDFNWRVMIEDDDQKHFLMNRLLLEVSHTNSYDKVRFAELTELLKELRELRYDQLSMGNSALIDAYDSATFAVSDQIFVFAQSHPRFGSTQYMSELIDEVNARNNYILMHRIHYDNWVKELNEFKKNYREEILAGGASLEVESMPLFQLPF